MAESTGTAAPARKPAPCASISVSCDGSKASASSVVPFGSAQGAGPVAGSGTPTGGLRPSSGSRTSRRLKASSSPGLATAASLPAGLGAAKPAAAGFQRAPSVPASADSGRAEAAATWGVPVAGQHLPAQSFADTSGFGSQWHAPASVMVPVCDTTLHAAASGALGSPGAIGLPRLSLESSALGLVGSTPLGTGLDCALGLDFGVPACSDLLDDCEASLSGSGDSTFSELLLPDDLELDLMFGDSLAALPALTLQRPPIGLTLRKSESLVNLINSHLSDSSSGGAVRTR